MFLFTCNNSNNNNCSNFNNSSTQNINNNNRNNFKNLQPKQNKHLEQAYHNHQNYLQKWYVAIPEKSKKKYTRELIATILSRKPKMSSFLEWKELKIVYKRFDLRI
jgi:hypothetical protein